MPAKTMTPKQAYVLDCLARVQPLHYKISVPNPLPRYQLDGWECTAQITGLVVRHRIKEYPGGRLERLD